MTVPVTLRDLWPTEEGRHPLADKFDICLTEGHDWGSVVIDGIYIVCNRCGSKTPGNPASE